MKIFISLLTMVFTLGLSQGSMAHDPDAKQKMAHDPEAMQKMKHDPEAMQKMKHKAVPQEMKVKREMAGKPQAEVVERSIIVPTTPPKEPDCEEGTDPDCDTDDDEEKDPDTDGLLDSAAELMSPG